MNEVTLALYSDAAKHQSHSQCGSQTAAQTRKLNRTT